MSSAVSPGNNRDRAISVEDVACERWPLEPVSQARDGWCDLQFVEDLEADLGGTIGHEGDAVEVKSCIARYGNRSGRWWIGRAAHEQLVDADGWYVLTVVDEETGDVLRMALVEASTVDSIIDGRWYDCGNGGRTVEEYHQRPWTAIFDGLDDPNGGGAQ